MTTEKNIYFASDFHLGIPDHKESLIRERLIVRWLEEIRPTAEAVYLVGDVFDFWFEYGTVIPKGFSRIIGKLCELQDEGIQVHLFHGNHDLWQFGYFEQEIGCAVHPKPILVQLKNHRFYIAHGDGLGPGQWRFKQILSIYRNRFFQRLFSWIHPDIGMRIAAGFSSGSRNQTHKEKALYLGDDKEYQVLHAKEIMKQQQVDFFIFGHRHLPYQKQVLSAQIVNLGDWFNTYTYAVYDGQDLSLLSYQHE